MLCILLIWHRQMSVKTKRNQLKEKPGDFTFTMRVDMAVESWHCSVVRGPLKSSIAGEPCRLTIKRIVGESRFLEKTSI